MALRRVERDVVGGEPEHAAETDQRQVAPRGKRLATNRDEDAEDGDPDREPRQRERAR